MKTDWRGQLLEAEDDTRGESLRWKRWTSAAAGVLVTAAVVAIIATAWRLQFGVDWSDESFYIALPWRFVLGDRPFIDELDLHQSAALLTYPLVWVWVHLRGSVDAIVPFMRVMWLAFSVAVAFVGYRFMSRLLARPLALACAAVFAVAIPFAIPALSYNTLGGGFLTIGLALLAIDVVDESSSWPRAAAAGLAHALAVVAYPTLVLPVAVAAVCYGLLAARRRGPAAVVAYLGVLLGLLGAAATLLLLLVGPAQLARDYAYTTGSGGYASGLQKLLTIAAGAPHRIGWSLLAQAVVLVVVMVGERRLPRLRLLLLTLPFLAWLTVDLDPTLRSLHWTIAFSVASLVLLSRLRSRSPMFHAASIIVPAALVAGLVTAYTSANGFTNAGIGMTPLLLIAFPLVLRCGLGDARQLREPFEAWLAACALAVFLGALVIAGHTTAYGDDALPALTNRVTAGPWAGVVTNDGYAGVMKQLAADVGKSVGPSDRVLSYYGSPGVYLLLGHRPATPAVWLNYDAAPDIGGRGVARLVQRYYGSHPKPDFMVDVNPGAEPGDDSPFARLAESTSYRTTVVRTGYVIRVLAKTK